jgi:DNA-binding MarR family transcriptional regulator
LASRTRSAQVPPWTVPGRRNLLFRSFIVGSLVNDLMSRAFAEAPLRPSDFGVLSALNLWGPTTPTDLANRLGMPPTTLSTYVRQLGDAGLLRRKPNPEDGRSALLEATAAGVRALRACFPALRECILAVQDELDRPAEEVEDALEAFEEALRRASRAE